MIRGWRGSRRVMGGGQRVAHVTDGVPAGYRTIRAIEFVRPMTTPVDGSVWTA